MMASSPIMTLGHSTNSLEEFLGILRRYEVGCVVDVRSVPYSSHASQFNREHISRVLTAGGVEYVYRGHVLGGRADRPGVFDEDGVVMYRKMRQQEDFREAIGELLAWNKQEYALALMCAESDPLVCHRFALIAPALQSRGCPVTHILSRNEAETHRHLEKKMVESYFGTASQIGLFPEQSPEGYLRRAYEKKNREIGFQRQDSRHWDER